MLDSLRGEKSGSYGDDPFHQRIRDWKDLAKTFLTELYTLRRAINSIDQRYLEGQAALFPGAAEEFGDLVTLVENLIDIYNGGSATRFENLERRLRETGSEEQPARLVIHLADLTQKIDESANDRATDMAKAEALTLMGESEKAMKFADRHVHGAHTMVS